MSSLHTTISPLDLVKEIPQSLKSSAEPANLDVESESVRLHGATLNSAVLSVSKFYGKKTTVCKERKT